MVQTTELTTSQKKTGTNHIFLTILLDKRQVIWYTIIKIRKGKSKGSLVKKNDGKRIEELLNGIYELEFQGTMTFEEFADGYDFWVDEDDCILIEGRGMHPLDGVRKVGHVDNGVIYAY